MSLVQINWQPDAKELRRFGIGMLILGAVFSALIYFLKGMPDLALGLFLFCAVSGVLGLTGTKAGLPCYWLWMALSWILGALVSPIVFALVYYLLFTPIALLMHLTGRDRLWLRKPDVESYWRDAPHPTNAKRYQRQF